MPKRTKIVTAMLATAHQIVEIDKFTQDTALYADMAQATEQYSTARALRRIVEAREADAMQMRERMTELAEALAALPV